MVHLGVAAEVWAEQRTMLIKYSPQWDVWDSYTWWWIFLLVMEWVGGLVVPEESRKPLDQALLRYGKLGWFLLHFILICTVFSAGFFMGFRFSR